MVRQKNRWLLVQFDYEPNIISQCTQSLAATKKRKLDKYDSQNSTSLDEHTQIRQITSTDIFRSLQETLTQNYGIVASSTTELSVRLYDPNVQLAVIKTSREKYPIVRSSLVFLTKVKQIKVVATIISVSGSSRTARNTAWEEIRKRFFSKDTAVEYGLLLSESTCKSGVVKASLKKSRAATMKALADFEERMEKIGSSC